MGLLRSLIEFVMIETFNKGRALGFWIAIPKTGCLFLERLSVQLWNINLVFTKNVCHSVLNLWGLVAF